MSKRSMEYLDNLVVKKLNLSISTTNESDRDENSVLLENSTSSASGKLVNEEMETETLDLDSKECSQLTIAAQNVIHNKMEQHYETVKKSKTPASWIEEISRKEGRPPKWETFDVSGQLNVNEPRFKTILHLTYKGVELQGEATERNKKDAKHNAAKDLLDNKMKLSPKDYYEINGGVKPSAPTVSVVVQSTTNGFKDADMGHNPIGELSEMCIKLGLSPPVYDEDPMEGPSHMPTLVVHCTINGIKKSDQFSNKRIAKRRVAYKWLMELKGQSVEETRRNMGVEGEDSGTSLEELVSNLRLRRDNVLKIPCSGSKEDCSRVLSHKNHLFQKWCGPLIIRLKNGESAEAMWTASGGPVPFLESLGHENKFTVDYQMFKGERHQAVLSLHIEDSELPDAVFLGRGDTEELAKDDAAKKAVDHILALSK